MARHLDRLSTQLPDEQSHEARPIHLDRLSTHDPALERSKQARRHLDNLLTTHPELGEIVDDPEVRSSLLQMVHAVAEEAHEIAQKTHAQPLQCFDVAVFHQNQWPAVVGKKSKKDWVSTIWQNLETYEQVLQDMIDNSRGRRPKLIVFPEDGIYTIDFMYATGASGQNLVQKFCVPTALLEIGRNLGSVTTGDDEVGPQVLQFLGTLAMRYGVFIVACVFESCNGWLFNTAVAISPLTGQLVARHRKEHLFDDEAEYVYSGFDFPGRHGVDDASHLQDSVFSVPIEGHGEVKFGLVICADLMFRKPLHALKANFGVTHIAAPVMWYDDTTPTLPQFQAVSWQTGLVLAVANQLGRDMTEGTSGIFCDYETLGRWQSSEGTLIASVPFSPSTFGTRIGIRVPHGCEPPIVSSHSPLFVAQRGTGSAEERYPYGMAESFERGDNQVDYMEVHQINHADLGDLWCVCDRQPAFRKIVDGHPTDYHERFKSTRKLSEIIGAISCVYEFYFTSDDVKSSIDRLKSVEELGQLLVPDLLKRVVATFFNRCVLVGTTDGVHMQECVLQPAIWSDGNGTLNWVHECGIDLPSLVKITVIDETQRDCPMDVVLPLLEPRDRNQPFSKRDFTVYAKDNVLEWEIKNQGNKLLKAILRVIPTSPDGNYYSSAPEARKTQTSKKAVWKRSEKKKDSRRW